MPGIPMVSYETAARAGQLPIVDKPARFAVGDPNGMTSNSWRVWVERRSEIYIACRDNFTETKVSLHASGRWRMGFTSEALKKTPTLVQSSENRAWEVWDRPPAMLPQTTTAFHLYFPTSELAVDASQRVGKKWKNVVYLEAAPPGKTTTVTLFITNGDIGLRHESEPSFLLASFSLDNGHYAKLMAHGDPEGTLPDMIARCVELSREMAREKGIAVPSTAFSYFFGHRDNGARFICGARMNRNGMPNINS